MIYTGIMVYRENMNAVRIWRLSIHMISNITMFENDSSDLDFAMV